MFVLTSRFLNTYGLIRYMWNVINILGLFSQGGVRMGFASEAKFVKLVSTLAPLLNSQDDLYYLTLFYFFSWAACGEYVSKQNTKLILFLRMFIRPIWNLQFKYKLGLKLCLVLQHTEFFICIFSVREKKTSTN